MLLPYLRENANVGAGQRRFEQSREGPFFLFQHATGQSRNMPSEKNDKGNPIREKKAYYAAALGD
jgi:hypothetical protein